jgi:hypothetical protein
VSRMKRKQIYVDPDQDRRLRALSRRQGKTESQVIREGIDCVLKAPVPPSRKPLAWKEARAFIDRLTALGPVKGKRTWTREELHER